ncbi:conserved hypothetical protein [Theileria orientalis strain Shintoku]|uniref:CNH domain-containing protein n=1 Tax=Theileria orientalis strain Shintoku TaxID=869250 RepID=J4CD39_THEOR|nr:conserved hypothetical protein [Theileria orientalis strain Shintoku]BAM40472.1 conserved hypothetical protein [Theileria orientalis strain Shintoku]|eukprot:XP_009690773.1 conserved hypothetical protein [Theileria orientalis strain Shintoku]
MTNLRHLVFLEKKLVSIENRDGKSLNITNIVDVVGDELFLFLLESTGVVWICYKPWVKFDETTHLRFVSFKSFEFEATNIFYCPLKHILIVIGREQEYDSMLKFNTYDLLTLMNNYDQEPQMIQSTPLFPNLNEFKPESNINIAISECCSIVAISTESRGIYFYKNYVIPSDDNKLYIIPYQKLEYKVEVKKIHLYIVEGAYYLIVVTEYELVSYNLTENCLVFKETSEVKLEVSCKLKSNKFAVYKGNKIQIYDVVKGLIKQISTSGSTVVEQAESPTNTYGLNTSNRINSNNNNNIKLYSFNEYIINCNVDNIFDNNNIILINVYSYLLDITFIAYSYYIPRLVYIVQSMNNLYLFTTNTNAGTNKDVLNAGISATSNILIFELKNKNIYERIEILIKKRLFKWAIKLAEFEKRPLNEVEEIYKIYADWLYTKNRYNESIQCYCRSGSAVEPCYVIQKFLILNSKVYLYKYLYYLHMNNKDNYILTILLIQLLYNINSTVSINGSGNSIVAGNMSDEDIDYKKELYKFLSKFGNTHKKSIKEAIVECRNTNKYEFASLIASYQNDTQELLNILLEDLQDFRSAYELLKKVERKVQYQAILRHHKILLKHDIDQLLDLICQIFNAEIMSSSSVSGASAEDVEEVECEIKLDRIINTFILENEFLKRLLEIFDNKNDSLLLYTIRLNLLLQQYYNLTHSNGSGGSTVVSNSNANGSTNSNSTNSNSTNSNSTNADVNGNSANCTTNSNSTNGDAMINTGVSNTNGTMSSNGNNNISSNNEDELLKIEDNILKLLNLNNVSSQNELISLLLCLLYNYKRGSIIMSIKMGYYNLPLILLDNQNDNINLLEYVFNYGYNEPILYVNMLKLLLK